jgi:hypothetical protein
MFMSFRPLTLSEAAYLFSVGAAMITMPAVFAITYSDWVSKRIVSPIRTCIVNSLMENNFIITGKTIIYGQGSVSGVKDGDRIVVNFSHNGVSDITLNVKSLETLRSVGPNLSRCSDLTK